MIDKNVHRMKKNINSRNVKSKFHCKYENSTYTSTYSIRGNKRRKKQVRREETEWNDSIMTQKLAYLFYNRRHMAYPFKDAAQTASFNPLNAELNPICYLLALLGAHHFLHVSRIRVKLLTFRLLMPYIYGAPILDVSRSHTTTQHSR